MNPTYDFQGQVALVTGAASGIGLAAARAFAQCGAAVVLAGRDEPALHAAADVNRSSTLLETDAIALCAKTGASR